jgi:glycosyltransferase involved in cell wall biosynthesis
MVVARGVDAHRFSPAHRSEALRARWGVSPDQPVMLSVGRLAREKNLDLLVRCWHAMRAQRPDLKLVVVGDGPLRGLLAQNCPDALMVGAQGGDELARHYASADVFVFPSVTETYGNVTPEALASGLAVLAFDYAAAAELIRHGDNGLLAPRGDEATFIRSAIEMVNNPALVQRLRERGRATTLTQDWAQIARQVETVWHQLLARPPSGGRA